MKIEVKNLGNIREGVFDISKKLTLFCGPNNTGKTYVSYVIYSLLKSLRRFIPTEELPDLNELLTNGEISFELNRKLLLQYRKERTNSINLESVFGLSDIESKTLFTDLSVSYTMSDDSFWEKVVHEELNYVFPWEGFDVRVEKESGSISIKVTKENSGTSTNTDSFFLEWQLIGDICEKLINYPYSNACIFPVERNSIYTFNKELSIQRNELIEQMQALKDKKKIGYESVDRLLGRSTRYPLAIRDCLAVANDLNNLQKKTSEYYSFAEEIEKGLLNGKIVVTKNGDVQFAPKAGKRLPVQLSASIVKTLSSLTFYLKHIATKGDLIIIDEPEMNLHPDAQVLLTRVFARLMNNGLNLLVSTHSDYIVRELSNLISLGSIQDNSSLLFELGYCKEECIRAEDVSVYLFKPVRKNSMTTQVTPVVVEEDGFAIETIDEVIYRSNVDSDKIADYMRYER